MATLVALQAGDHVMKVHASVLADNSDYFKAIMMSGRWPSTPLLVPFVHPKALVHLVQFMYSRHMEVDHQGVQDVLLAARLLGMPKAVGACQDILAQQGLARPMPFPWIWTPAMAPSWRPPMDMYRSEWAIGSLRAPPPVHFAPIPQAREVSSAAPPQTIYPTGIDTSCASTAASSSSSSQTMALNDARPNETIDDRQDLHGTTRPSSPECSGHQNTSTSATASPCPSISQVKVVIDVAWCDGPVRFQRVLNDNCNLFICNGSDDQHVSKRSKKTSKRQQQSSPGHPKTAPAEDANGDNHEEQSTSSCHQSNYNCIYCNLSFKSHHCYAKHKRRHLNPRAVDSTETADCGKSLKQVQTDEVAPKSPPVGTEDDWGTDGVVPSPKALSSPTTSTASKTLELNVPFYPCKACGSKFPSYYFVHKHSKVCHGVVVTQEQDGSE